MRLLFVTSEYPHFLLSSSGGIGSSIHSLGHFLTSKGHRVFVIVFGQKIKKIFRDGNIVILSLTNPSFKCLNWFFIRKQTEFLIKKMIKKVGIELVEFPEWTGISALMLLKIPVVIKLHGSDTFFCHLENRKVKFKNWIFEYLSLKNANNLLAVSDFVGKLTVKLFHLNKDYQIIHNGLNISDKITLHNHQDFNIFYFGSIVRKKGVLEIPLIFNQVKLKIPSAKLHLIGRDTEDRLSGSTSTKKLFFSFLHPTHHQDVFFYGHLDFENMKKQMQIADVCIFPSFAECWPMSWMESMAFGIPMVCSNGSWAKEMLTDGYDALLRNPLDHQSFSDAVVSLSDPCFNKFIAANARNTVLTKYSLVSAGEKFVTYYSNLIDSCV